MAQNDQDSSVQALSPEEEQARKDQERAQKEADDKVIQLARARFDLCSEAEREVREDHLDDSNFSIGDQWDMTVKQERQRDNRPCHTINRMPQYIQQVVNDHRQNRPAIRVHPTGGGATEPTAKIFGGLIRNIEYTSNADIAYDTGMDGAARGGFGYWRVKVDYERPDSFDRALFIERIKNPAAVSLDPNCKQPDGSDAEYGFISEWFDKASYRERWPDSELASLDWKMIGNRAPRWMREGSCLVVEYFYKHYTPQKIHLLSTGQTVKDEDLEATLERIKQAQIAAEKMARFDGQIPPKQEEVTVVESRIAKIPTVVHLHLNGIEILERTTFPGRFIPIVPMLGNEVFVDGKRKLESLIRYAKDAQKMRNYWKSAQTEAIALAPRAPFIVAKSQIKGFEKIWSTANTKNHAYLPYNPKDIGGTPIPPPQRQAFEPAIQAITVAAAGSEEDMKATTGMWDPTMGMNHGDQSGIAIQRLNRQSQTGNFHFQDNMTRALRHTGRILVWAIPEVYDGERTQRIIQEDDQQVMVELNKWHIDDKGNRVIYAMDVGTYDVTVDAGPSFATKRQEAAASMMEVTKAFPPIFQAAGDIMVRSMDWPQASEVADRLRKANPIAMQDDKVGKNLPPAVKQQMDQMSAMIQQLTEKLHEQQQIIETKQIEHEGKKELALLDAQVQLMKTEAQVGTQADLEVLRHEVAILQTHLKALYAQNQNPGSAGPGAEGAGGPAPQPPTGGAAPGQSMES